MRKVTVPFFISHQGCSHTCVFCDQRTISGSSGAIPSTDEILEKIEAWRKTAGDRPLEVAFFGGSFTAMPQDIQDHLLQPLQNLLQAGDIASVRVSTRPDCVNDEIVARLSRLGVSTIELGVQSMDDDVLERADRGHTSADSEAGIRCVKAGGLSVGAQLMPGLPGDTIAKSVRSLQRVIAAGADFLRLYPAIVLRGTELARRFQTGNFIPMTVDEGVQLCKILLHESMRSSVPVIRIGLQADDGLNSTTVLGGCWHPSFGRLVRSELYFDLLCSLLTEIPPGLPCIIRCHPSRISEVNGQARINLTRLGNRVATVQVSGDETLKKEELAIDSFNYNVKGNIVSNLTYSIDKE
jgi:histone acetyltransferase (RNA polymerase elongator complex component)